MEGVNISFGNSEKFDRYLAENRQSSLPDYGDLEIITKNGATKNGKSAVMISFTVNVNGKRRRVQTVTTLNILALIASACQRRQEFENEQDRSGPLQ